MDPWKDGAEILEIVRSWNWTPELFERCKNSILVDPCIFNQIRKALTTSEYEQFDRMYCEYVNPGQRKIIDYIIETREDGEEKGWKNREAELLRKKRQLLKRRLRTLTGN